MRKIILVIPVLLALTACAGTAPQTETGKAVLSLAPIVATRLYLERHPGQADEVAATANAVLAALDGEVVTLAILRARAADAIGYDKMEPADQILVTRLADAIEADIAARATIIDIGAAMDPGSVALARSALEDVRLVAEAMAAARE